LPFFSFADFRHGLPQERNAPGGKLGQTCLGSNRCSARRSARCHSSSPGCPKVLSSAEIEQWIERDEEFAKHALREADFNEPMTAVLAKQLGGVEAMKAACKNSLRDTPVEIEATVFGDLDGDGIDEAAVTAFSCQAGQAGPDLFAVFKQLKSGDIIELPLERLKDGTKFKGKDLPQNLRGPWRIEIDKRSLIVRYLFWGPDAPKCGDADVRATSFIIEMDKSSP
jgi:hypothetical protein